MNHSYLKTNVVYQGKHIELGTALKTSKGAPTSERVHIDMLKHFSHRINYKALGGILSHTDEERKKRAKINKC